ncbi:MAG TPA: DNA polymerase IV, partial [Acidimicrobiia bacterium]
LQAARELLESVGPLISSQGLTLIGLTISNLDNHTPVQLELPFERRLREALDFAPDDLAVRYGPGVVTRAVLLGRDHGPSIPMLPD